MFAVLRTAKPGIGMQCAAHCQPYLRPGMEPCHISFGSSLDGEGAAIPLLLDQLLPSFARYDLQVPITGPRFFPAGFEDEEASFAYTSQESTWTRLSSQCVSGASQCRSRRTKRRRARRQREPMALSIKSETEPSGWSCLSGLAAQAVIDPQSVEEQVLEVIQDLEVEASQAPWPNGVLTRFSRVFRRAARTRTPGACYMGHFRICTIFQGRLQVACSPLLLPMLLSGGQRSEDGQRHRKWMC